MNLNIIHPTWAPILREFNTDAFLLFKNRILRENKYYPEADEVFRVLSMSFHDVQVVCLGKEHDSELAKQGVLNLPFSLTRGVDIDHEVFWNPIIKKIVYLIARHKRVVWLLGSTKAQAFTANMPVKTIFNVLGYDDSTIKQIPIADYNYIFKGIYINLDYVNTILLKKGQKTINWNKN